MSGKCTHGLLGNTLSAMIAMRWRAEPARRRHRHRTHGSMKMTFPKIICPMSLCLLPKLWHWLNKQVMTWRSRVLRERVCVGGSVCVCVA